jgi:hypothetical protein
LRTQRGALAVEDDEAYQECGSNHRVDAQFSTTALFGVECINSITSTANDQG